MKSFVLAAHVSAGVEIVLSNSDLLQLGCRSPGCEGRRRLHQQTVHTHAGPQLSPADLLLVDPDPVRDRKVRGGGPLTGGAHPTVPVPGLPQAVRVVLSRALCQDLSLLEGNKLVSALIRVMYKK